MDTAVSQSEWTWKSAYPAPAKINLFLHVTGRRADGYHLLQTAFRMLDRCDTLSFRPRDDGRVVCERLLPGVPEQADLCWRAAQLLREASGCRDGVSITLDKCLPMGGGLGGGSSDAATVLLALNHLWRLGVSRQDLQALALRLGADVPFFVYGRTAIAQGVGELFEAFSPEPRWYLVLEPGVGVPTAEIFSAEDLTRNSEPAKIADFSETSCRNDLQPVVCRRYREVADALECLAGYKGALMSGSGACVFAPFATQGEAVHALQALPPGCVGWVARGVDEHPLHGLAS